MIGNGMMDAQMAERFLMMRRLLAGMGLLLLAVLGGWYALPWVIDLQGWEARVLQEAETRWKWRVVSEGIRPAWFPPGTLRAPKYRFSSLNADRPWGELSECRFRPAWGDLLRGSVRIAGGGCERFTAGSSHGGVTLRDLRFAHEDDRLTLEGDIESLGPIEAPLRVLSTGSGKQGTGQTRSASFRHLAGAFRTDERGLVVEHLTLGGEDDALSVTGRVDGKDHLLDLQVSGRLGNRPFRLAIQGPSDHPRLRLESNP